MHFIVPLIYPNRCDNEAYISERIDLTNINAYLARRNATETDFPFTMFHIIVVALLKTITLRPKMNRFIANKNVYQRHAISAAFVVKKLFSDNGAEALAIVYSDPTDNIDSLRAKLYKQISSCRSDALDRSSDSMDILNKMPLLPVQILSVSYNQAGQARLVPGIPNRLRPVLFLGAADQPWLHKAEERLSPPDQLGHLLHILRGGRKEEQSLLQSGRHV